MEAVSIFLIVGLSFSFIFLLKRLTGSDFRVPARLMPIIVLSILTLELFYGWLYGSRFILQLPHLIRLNSPFLYVIGPAIYLLIRSLVFPEMRWAPIQLFHLVPFLVSVVYLVPLYTASTAEKVNYISEMYNSLSFDSFLLGGTRRLHQGVYIFFSALLIYKEQRALRVVREFKASLLIVGAFTSLWLISVYRYFFQFDLMSGLLDVFILSFIAIFLVYRQLSGEKNRKRQLSKDDVMEMENEMSRIQDLLARKKDYLNPHYTIGDMAKSLDLSIPTVSRVINRTESANFNELINRYKVQEAITLLQSESTRHLTIEAIANSAGFNSVSAFNENFKRITGQSPKHYRKADA